MTQPRIPMVDPGSLEPRFGNLHTARTIAQNSQALDRTFTEDAIFEVIDLVRMEGLAEIRRSMHEEG